MKSMNGLAIGLGVLTVLCAACSTSGDGDNEPPPTVTKYYAYVTNDANDTVSGYSINTTTGAWTPVPGSPFPTGSQPRFVAVDPAGKFAWVLYGYPADESYIAAYAVDGATGALAEISGSPFFALAFQGLNLAFEPTGRFLYKGGNFQAPGSALVAFTDNQAGQLAYKTWALYEGAWEENFEPPWNTRDIKVDPSGHNLMYVANDSSKIGVYGYRIDPSTGDLELIPGSPYLHEPGGAWALAVDPQSKFLYATFPWSNLIAAYSINTATGQLTEISDSPYQAGTFPRSVTVDPAGRFLYAAYSDSQEVMTYAIHATTGALSLVSSVFKSGTSPSFVTIEPTGKFAYVGDSVYQGIFAYSVNTTTGTLTASNVSPFPINAGPDFSVAFVKITQ
jgi:6-phosphogluconolactonase